MSSNDWRKYKIGELGRVITGKTPSTKDVENFGGTYPFITIPDLDTRVYIDSSERKISDIGASKMKSVLLPPNSVMISCIATIGKCGITTKPSFTNQQINSVVCNQDVVFPLFLYYIFTQLRHELEAAGGGGSVYTNVSKSRFSEILISLPPLPTQRNIANILSALDDKIELNRQTNATIETITKSLFKSWFMDFDPVRAKVNGHTSSGMDNEIAKLFPNKFIDTEIGEIPANWEVRSIGEVAERVAMGPFGSSIKVETFVDEGIPIISGQHLRGFMLTDSTFNYVSLEHAEKLKKANVYHGDVIFTHAGNIENLAFIPEDSKYSRYIVSQRQFYVRCNLEIVSPSFITFYFQSPEGQHKLLANKSPVGVPSIAQPVTYLRSIKLPIPPKPILDEFERVTTPLLQKYQANVHESQTLTSLRDTLLPKLMRGEIEA